MFGRCVNGKLCLLNNRFKNLNGDEVILMRLLLIYIKELILRLYNLSVVIV